MATLIDGLLTLSRSTRGELRRDTLDLSERAQRLLGELAQSDPQRRVAVEIQSGLLVRGDERLLEVSVGWARRPVFPGSRPMMNNLHGNTIQG